MATRVLLALSRLLAVPATTPGLLLFQQLSFAAAAKASTFQPKAVIQQIPGEVELVLVENTEPQNPPTRLRTRKLGVRTQAIGIWSQMLLRGVRIEPHHLGTALIRLCNLLGHRAANRSRKTHKDTACLLCAVQVVGR